MAILGRGVIGTSLDQGSLLIGNVANQAIPLLIGTVGQVLTSNGVTASWQPAAGGSGTITVREEGVSVNTNFTTLNFIGGSVTATDAGAGVANITVIGGGVTTFVALTDTPATIPANGMLIGNPGGTALINLATGTPGQVLTAVAGVPTWATPVSGFADPMTTIGDTIIRNGANATTRLPVGSAGQVLTVTAGVPAWAAVYADPMTSIGDVVIRNGSNVTTRLAAGSAGQVLTITGGVPSWLAPSSGFADPMTAAGDLIGRNIGNATSRIAIGTPGQVLTVAGGVAVWATPISGFTDPMTTAGDLIGRDAGNATTRIGVGTVGQVLKVVAGVPAWAADVGFADPMTTIGDLIVRDGSNATARLGIGAAGRVLTSNGTTASWQAGSGSVQTIVASTSGFGQINGIVSFPPGWTVTFTASTIVVSAHTVGSDPVGHNVRGQDTGTLRQAVKNPPTGNFIDITTANTAFTIVAAGAGSFGFSNSQNITFHIRFA
jgi:hypothetical protein